MGWRHGLLFTARKEIGESKAAANISTVTTFSALPLNPNLTQLLRILEHSLISQKKRGVDSRKDASVFLKNLNKEATPLSAAGDGAGGGAPHSALLPVLPLTPTQILSQPGEEILP